MKEHVERVLIDWKMNLIFYLNVLCMS